MRCPGPASSVNAAPGMPSAGRRVVAGSAVRSPVGGTTSVGTVIRAGSPRTSTRPARSKWPSAGLRIRLDLRHLSVDLRRSRLGQLGQLPLRSARQTGQPGRGGQLSAPAQGPDELGGQPQHGIGGGESGGEHECRDPAGCRGAARTATAQPSDSPTTGNVSCPAVVAAETDWPVRQPSWSGRSASGAARAGVVRADDRTVPCQVVQCEAVMAEHPRARTVRQRRRRAVALDDDLAGRRRGDGSRGGRQEARFHGPGSISGHARDAKL